MEYRYLETTGVMSAPGHEAGRRGRSSSCAWKDRERGAGKPPIWRGKPVSRALCELMPESLARNGSRLPGRGAGRDHARGRGQSRRHRPERQADIPPLPAGPADRRLARGGRGAHPERSTATSPARKPNPSIRCSRSFTDETLRIPDLHHPGLARRGKPAPEATRLQHRSRSPAAPRGFRLQRRTEHPEPVSMTPLPWEIQACGSTSLRKASASWCGIPTARWMSSRAPGASGAAVASSSGWSITSRTRAITSSSATATAGRSTSPARPRSGSTRGSTRRSPARRCSRCRPRRPSSSTARRKGPAASSAGSSTARRCSCPGPASGCTGSSGTRRRGARRA